ncbi:hypothetical protein LOAG_17055 [Loa loa]|uniref:PPM-type phosphatase domain-containing protein n=1 Tax=Loa loa TaxID=7209 RepID=A0A1S0UM58_LOALO|nr:hypothetical protein LOAG_17055 [Loa loa]EJD75874.1 hypothetical protein LOAG_17055 [Loa loa]
MHWYDRIYDACKHSNGYSAPEAFYGPGKNIASGCELQHKTFSYVDHRSGRAVRLYGIVDRYSPGADADFLISQIVNDLLPFDRTTDHVLNNDPSDRQIYCLLDEVLRKVYKVDLNSSNASTRSYLGSESRGSPGSSGSRHENNGTLQINNLSNGNFVKPNNPINLPNSSPLNQPISEAVAQNLPTKRRGGMANRKYVTRNTTLPPISELAEKWWTEEGEYLTGPERYNFDFPDNTVIPHSIPTPFQATSVTPPVEVARSSDDDEFLHEIEKVAIDLGYIENSAFKESGETASVKSEDKFMDSSGCGDSVSYTAAAIVFIYGDKMFVGSIGDSRIVLMRQKCHYLDVMYLNEPPLAWYPIAAAKNSYFKDKHYILFQEPIIRGGFLINEFSIFLLMFNEGVITNMLNLNEYHRTSNEINRSAVQMVIKILEKYPEGDIAQKFVAHIKHSCNRKYRPVAEFSTVKREGMSFLFADLRQLIPTKPEYDQLLRTYQPKPDISESTIEAYPRMTEYSSPLEDNEEAMNNALSMNKVYDMFQEIFDREESERRAMNSAPSAPPVINENTWVFLRSDQN